MGVIMGNSTDEVQAAPDVPSVVPHPSSSAFSVRALIAPVVAAACLGASFVLTGSGVTAGFAIIHAPDAVENQFNLAALPFLLPGTVSLALLALALWLVTPRLKSMWMRLGAGIVLAAAVPVVCAAILGLAMGDPGSDIPWILGLFFQPMAFTALLYWLPALATAIWASRAPRGLLKTLSTIFLSLSLGLLTFSTVWYVIGGRTS